MQGKILLQDVDLPLGKGCTIHPYQWFQGNRLNANLCQFQP
jgi:hypothetical protein